MVGTAGKVLAGLAVAEVAGVTNFTGGGGGGENGGMPGVPGMGDIQVNVPTPDPADIVVDTGRNNVPNGLTTMFRNQQKQINNLKEQLRGGSPSGNSPRDNAGGSDGNYQLQNDYSGPGTHLVRGAASTVEATGNTVKKGGGFASENPYFVAGTTIGAVSPDPVTTVTGAGVGAVAEIGVDTATGNTPLGVQSPIDVTGKGPWWQGPDPLNAKKVGHTVGSFTGNGEGTESHSGTKHVKYAGVATSSRKGESKRDRKKRIRRKKRTGTGSTSGGLLKQ